MWAKGQSFQTALEIFGFGYAEAQMSALQSQVMCDSRTPRTIARQSPLFSIISYSLLKFMITESMMLSNHPIFCVPLLLLPSIFPSIRIFAKESDFHIRLLKYQSLNISNFRSFKASFHSNPKERQCQRMFSLLPSCTHFTRQRVMLKILQGRLQWHMN